MGARGDIESIPEAALFAEARIQQAGAIAPNSAVMHTFLSSLRQERLLARMCVAMEAIAGELVVPAPKPKGKGKG